MLQEEVMRLQDEIHSSGGSVESASSGYMSPQFYLRPPSPGEQFTSTDTTQPRRSSDSAVGSSNQNDSTLKPSTSGHSAISEPLQQLYDEMYNNTELSSPTPQYSGSRRYSYPNSPVHILGDKSHQSTGLSQHLQMLKLQKKSLGTPNLAVIATQDQPDIVVPELPASRWKGSITQGVPSRATVKSEAPTLADIGCQESLNTPHIIAHSHSFDETLGKHKRIPGSLTALWSKHQSVSMYDSSSGDCNSLPNDHLNAESYLRPGICVTNVTGDEILVYGSCEPMDQSS